MKKYLIFTLVVSVLVGIILPIIVGVKDSTYIAISFSLVWAIYSIILFGYVFLIEGRQKRNKSEKRKEEDPFPPELIQECEALWRITVKKTDQEEREILWS